MDLTEYAKEVVQGNIRENHKKNIVAHVFNRFSERYGKYLDPNKLVEWNDILNSKQASRYFYSKVYFTGGGNVFKFNYYGLFDVYALWSPENKCITTFITKEMADTKQTDTFIKLNNLSVKNSKLGYDPEKIRREYLLEKKSAEEQEKKKYGEVLKNKEYKSFDHIKFDFDRTDFRTFLDEYINNKKPMFEIFIKEEMLIKYNYLTNKNVVQKLNDDNFYGCLIWNMIIEKTLEANFAEKELQILQYRVKECVKFCNNTLLKGGKRPTDSQTYKKLRKYCGYLVYNNLIKI